MDVRYVDQGGIQVREIADRTGSGLGGFIWVDIPEWSDEAETYLRDLGCHEMVLESCRTRNHVPTVHRYADHGFITTQSPLLGDAGHVHQLELDQISGRDHLVTVHGPLNPIVDPAEAPVETDSVLRRIESGRFRPATPHELSFAVTSTVARRQPGMINQVAEKLPGLEKQVMDSRLTNPEALLPATTCATWPTSSSGCARSPTVSRTSCSA